MSRDAVPQGAAGAAARLSAARVPAEIVEVAAVLQRAGHAAVLAGGAVRDVLLGLDASDWDLATSATPTEVQALFKRTVPTGLAHGTITVLVRDRTGPKQIPVEVTTFRGEGAYLDGRRPTEVTFLRDLEQDLARRDFTVNAFAWDPIGELFTDPFDGLQDLRDGWIRAVGDPAARFAEDGLRTMRAVRFCATRSLMLEPHTEAAIGGALPVLDKVSRERVLIELSKLLSAEQPSRGLNPMVTTGMWLHIFPELEPNARAAAVARVDRFPRDVGLRLACLLYPLVYPSGVGSAGAEHDADGAAKAIAAVVKLRPSKDLRRRLETLWGPAVATLATAKAPAEIRRAVAALGRAHLSDAMLLLDADLARGTAVDAATLGAALSVGELAVAGRDLVAAEVCAAGPALGELLRRLLDDVLDEPALNQPEALVERARRYAGG